MKAAAGLCETSDQASHGAGCGAGNGVDLAGRGLALDAGVHELQAAVATDTEPPAQHVADRSGTVSLPAGIWASGDGDTHASPTSAAAKRGLASLVSALAAMSKGSSQVAVGRASDSASSSDAQVWTQLLELLFEVVGLARGRHSGALVAATPAQSVAEPHYAGADDELVQAAFVHSAIQLGWPLPEATPDASPDEGTRAAAAEVALLDSVMQSLFSRPSIVGDRDAELHDLLRLLEAGASMLLLPLAEAASCEDSVAARRHRRHVFARSCVWHLCALASGHHEAPVAVMRDADAPDGGHARLPACRVALRVLSALLRRYSATVDACEIDTGSTEGERNLHRPPARLVVDTTVIVKLCLVQVPARFISALLQDPGSDATVSSDAAACVPLGSALLPLLTSAVSAVGGVFHASTLRHTLRACMKGLSLAIAPGGSQFGSSTVQAALCDSW